jgi:hypothetical protein
MLKMEGPSKHPMPAKGLARSLHCARETIGNSEKIVVVAVISHEFGEVNVSKRTKATTRGTVKRWT